MVRSKKISGETAVGNSVVKSADYNEAENHSLIQVIEHVFKEDEDPAAGYPVTRVKELKVRAETKLAIVRITGFEFWFGTKEQEIMIATSRGASMPLWRATLVVASSTVKVRANLSREKLPMNGHGGATSWSSVSARVDRYLDKARSTERCMEKSNSGHS